MQFMKIAAEHRNAHNCYIWGAHSNQALTNQHLRFG